MKAMINQNKYFDKKYEILDFIYQNREKYSRRAFSILEDAILLDECLEIKESNMPTYIAQLLSKFNVYNEGRDEYLEIIKLLEKYSFLQGNCCEVGAGRYPRLAELAAPKIKLNGGTLTIYDPKISFSIVQDATIVKEKFTKTTNTDSIDTIYGLFPCEASIAMAEKAFEEDKNLLLAFCDCDHTTQKYQHWVGKYWAEDVCMEFREKYGKEAQIIKWSSPIKLDFPILVRESSKNKVKKQ